MQSIKEEQYRKEAIDIFKKLMPKWQGIVMLFRSSDVYGEKIRNVMVDGDKIYKIILKAVKDSYKK